MCSRSRRPSARDAGRPSNWKRCQPPSSAIRARLPGPAPRRKRDRGCGNTITRVTCDGRPSGSYTGDGGSARDRQIRATRCRSEAPRLRHDRRRCVAAGAAIVSLPRQLFPRVRAPTGTRRRVPPGSARCRPCTHGCRCSPPSQQPPPGRSSKGLEQSPDGLYAARATPHRRWPRDRRTTAQVERHPAAPNTQDGADASAKPQNSGYTGDRRCARDRQICTLAVGLE